MKRREAIVRGTSRLKAAAAAALLLALLPGSRPAPGDVVVRMTSGHTFNPPVVFLEPGGAVVWKNEDQARHTLIGDPALALHRIDIEPPSPPEPFHSEAVPPGATFRRSFWLEGVYRYVSLEEEDRGMIGTIIVERGRPRPR